MLQMSDNSDNSDNLQNLFREMYKSPAASMKGCNPPCWSLQPNLSLTKCAQRYEFDDDTPLFILHMYILYLHVC